MKLNIGENIRSCRRKMNLTQEQLAEKLGVSFQSVSRWENDMTYPDMELLPALMGIFGITADELLGISEAKKEQETEEIMGELVKLSMQKDAPAERINELIRAIRRDYLNGFTICHLRYSVNIDVYRRPEILPEIRLTMEQALESRDFDMADRNTMIRLMTLIEDDEHIEKFLDRYASGDDLSKITLLNERYRRRGEWEKDEPIRQLALINRIDSIIGSDMLWVNLGRPRDLNSHVLMSELQIEFLHKLCGQTPDKTHPVSADGELDFWVRERIWIGIKLSCRLAAAGRTEEAFLVLEDSVSLLEKVMAITEPTELRCASPFLKDIVYTAKEEWMFSDGNFFGEGKQERIIDIHNDYSLYCVVPSNILNAMKDEQGWAWFNPIREDERFKSCLARVEKLIVYKDE